jgi:septal ring factor EnvC (AmiA/AmiB activator)
MQRFALVLLGCLLASNLFAQSSADTVRQAKKVNQRVSQHQAEVQRLQQDVSQQESASQQAAERLQQQDRTIAELRKQLKAAQDNARTPATGH